MIELLAVYKQILQTHLTNVFVGDDIIDPVRLNKEKFKVKSVFIVTVIYYKYGYRTPSVNISVSHWLKYNFNSDNYFSRIIDNAEHTLVGSINTSLLNLCDFALIDIAGLYETLLGIEPGTAESNYDAKSKNNYRNKLGSYYTPPDLAKLVTFKTIDTFFKNNYSISDISKTQPTNNLKINKAMLLDTITTMSFVDFSCGGGNFLIQIIEYFEHIINFLDVNEQGKSETLKLIALNIYAFDVDCIALEIAKIGFLLRINQPSLYKSVENNFTHANFLLHNDNKSIALQRIDTFTSGFIYHHHLSNALDMDKKYDIIVGNPPWEKIRFEEKKFYALYTNTISTCNFKSTREKNIISEEENNSYLAAFSKSFRYEIKDAKQKIKNNKFFSLSSPGELNTYALFTEASIKLRSERGVVGLIVKSAIITSQINKRLFRHLSENKLIIGIYDFINRKKIFNIDSRERFCYMLLGKSKSNTFSVSMNLTNINDINNDQTYIDLTYEMLNLLNPDTGMLPNLSNKNEADFLIKLSTDYPSLKSKTGGAKFGRIVHFTNHSEFILRNKTKNNIPIYEGKFFHQFDGKYSGFNGLDDSLKYRNKSYSKRIDDQQKALDDYFPESRYFIIEEKWKKLSKHYNARYMLAWRSLTSATNTRTCIATLLPFMPASQSVQFLIDEESELLYLTGLFNSITFDYIVKKKLSGIDLTRTVLEQIPIPGDVNLSKVIWFDNSKNTIKNHILKIVHLLLRNDIRLDPLFKTLTMDNILVTKDSRFELIRKLDLLFIVLYNLSHTELTMVLSAFHNQYSKDDEQWFKDNLIMLGLRNKSIRPTIPSSAAACPI